MKSEEPVVVEVNRPQSRAKSFLRDPASWVGMTSAVGTLLIGLGLLFSYQQLEEFRTTNVRSFTFELLSDLSENADLAEANFHMVTLINAGSRINDASTHAPFLDRDGKELPIEVSDRKVVTLLNYYEMISTAWSLGAIEEELLFQVRGGPMYRAYQVTEAYIRDRREMLRAPDLYKNYRALIKAYEESPWFNT